MRTFHAEVSDPLEVVPPSDDDVIAGFFSTVVTFRTTYVGGYPVDCSPPVDTKTVFWD